MKCQTYQIPISLWSGKTDGKDGTNLAASRSTMSRRKLSLADDLVLLPWWISLILAIVAPAFLIRMPPPWSAFAPLALLFFLATAALSALRSIKTARMPEGHTSLASLRPLPWKRFEDLLAEASRRQGYKVEETL